MYSKAHFILDLHLTEQGVKFNNVQCWFKVKHLCVPETEDAGADTQRS